MKNGRTLMELAEELYRQNNAKKDYLIDTPALHMFHEDGKFQLGLGGQSKPPVPANLFDVNPLAHRQIGTSLGIPAKFYDKLQAEHADLLLTNVNSLFEREPARRMIRTMDGTARAFLSDKYRRIDNFEIAETVLPVIAEMPDARVESCEVTDERMYIKVVNPRLQVDVVPGDTVQSGIIITNSEVGLGSFKVQPLIYRLVCSNGMVVNDAAMRKYHVGRINTAGENYELYTDETLRADDHAFLLKARDTVRAAVDEAKFRRVVNMMREAKQIPLPVQDVPQLVELTAKEFKLSQDEGKGVLSHLIQGGDLSLYGLSNAITRHSQDVESYDRATELESIGFDVLTMPKATLKKISAEVA